MGATQSTKTAVAEPNLMDRGQAGQTIMRWLVLMACASYLLDTANSIGCVARIRLVDKLSGTGR
jgi:hypothetical protein